MTVYLMKMLCRNVAKIVILNEAKRSEESIFQQRIEILSRRAGTQNDKQYLFYRA
jgi:hypothetical protein